MLREEVLFHIDCLILFLSKSATDVKVTADMVKEALEEAEKAQIAAEKAIKQADEDIQGTQNLLTSVRSLLYVGENRHINPIKVHLTVT